MALMPGPSFRTGRFRTGLSNVVSKSKYPLTNWNKFLIHASEKTIVPNFMKSETIGAHCGSGVVPNSPTALEGGKI